MYWTTYCSSNLPTSFSMPVLLFPASNHFSLVPFPSYLYSVQVLQKSRPGRTDIGGGSLNTVAFYLDPK